MDCFVSENLTIAFGQTSRGVSFHDTLGVGGGGLSLHETLRVCLVGVKTGGWKIRREKYDENMTFFTIWFRR